MVMGLPVCLTVSGVQGVQRPSKPNAWCGGPRKVKHGDGPSSLSHSVGSSSCL